MKSRTCAPADMPSGGDEAALVDAACRGEPWARKELFMRHASHVVRLATHLLGPDPEVPDLVQDCFVEALTSLERLRDPVAFPKWLSLIIVRAAAQTLRRRRLRRRLGLLDADRAPFEAQMERLVAPNAPPDVVIELRRLFGALDALPTHLRVVVVLRKLEGCSVAEVARLVGSSISTVKRRLDEAERRLDRSGAGAAANAAGTAKRAGRS